MGHEAVVEAYLRVISVSTTHQIPFPLLYEKCYSQKMSSAKKMSPYVSNLYSPRVRPTFGQNRQTKCLGVNFFTVKNCISLIEVNDYCFLIVGGYFLTFLGIFFD